MLSALHRNCYQDLFYSLTTSEACFFQNCLDSSGPVDVYRTNQSPCQRQVADGPSSKSKFLFLGLFKLFEVKWPFCLEHVQPAIYSVGIRDLLLNGNVEI